MAPRIRNLDARGVRQEDPLSPLLFAVAADLLQCAINEEYEQGNLLAPFPQRVTTHFPIIQFADDTIVIMKADENQLVLLKKSCPRLHSPVA